MDVVIAVLLDLQEEAELGEALGGKSLQQLAVLLKVLQNKRQKQVNGRLLRNQFLITEVQVEAGIEHGCMERKFPYSSPSLKPTTGWIFFIL